MVNLSIVIAYFRLVIYLYIYKYEASQGRIEYQYNIAIPIYSVKATTNGVLYPSQHLQWSSCGLQSHHDSWQCTIKFGHLRRVLGSFWRAPSLTYWILLVLFQRETTNWAMPSPASTPQQRKNTRAFIWLCPNIGCNYLFSIWETGFFHQEWI